MSTPATPVTMQAAPAPGVWDRVKSAFQKGIPYFNPDFEVASHTDDGVLSTGEKPQMQLVTPEAAMTESEKKAHPIATAVAETAGGMTTPSNALAAGFMPGAAALKGMSMAPVALKALPKLVSAGFAADSLAGAYKMSPEFKAAMDKGDASEAERIFTHMTLTAGMGLLAGQHAAEGVDFGKMADHARTAVNRLSPSANPEAGFASLDGHRVVSPAPKAVSPDFSSLSGHEKISDAPNKEVTAYRARPVGEQGVAASDRPTATSSLEEATQYAHDLQKMTGKPHEVVAFSPEEVQEHPSPNEGNKWYQITKEVPEEKVTRPENTSENKKSEPAKSPKQTIEDAGLIYKGELVPGSGVHMFEHPDHPGRTAAMPEGKLTPASVKAKMDSKIAEFEATKALAGQ